MRLKSGQELCVLCGGVGCGGWVGGYKACCRKQWRVKSGSPQGPLWLGTERMFPPCCPQSPIGCSINWGPHRGPQLHSFPGAGCGWIISSPTKPALDLGIDSRKGALSGADSFERGNPWRWDGGRGRGGVRAGVPFPHSFWDLFWGQRGKPRLGPLKQEKLESALNSERVCWGLASCGLPQPLGRHGALPPWFPGSRAGLRLLNGLMAFPLPRAAMGEEAARHKTESGSGQGVGHLH